MGPRLGVDVAVPGDLVWELLTDVSCWSRWGPTVGGARLDDRTSTLSAGARGSVRTPVGAWLGFRVDRWQPDPPRRTWSWTVAGVPATEHTVLDRGPERCRVEMGVPWWATPYLAVTGLALVRIRRLAEGDRPDDRPDV
ncbi:SRPBCC family protein [Nocardioides campestrisoli]|uniref:SRPBCC family protein n=1 Tax=Nocardioides campestrisoli TaxID=2736757 RepID=UPI0015E7CDDC|nr:SRPBCC family protein [Nocardioides campestrisoli]